MVIPKINHIKNLKHSWNYVNQFINLVLKIKLNHSRMIVHGNCFLVMKVRSKL